MRAPGHLPKRPGLKLPVNPGSGRHHPGTIRGMGRTQKNSSTAAGAGTADHTGTRAGARAPARAPTRSPGSSRSRSRSRRRPPQALVLLALLAYSAVMVSLTMLKAFFVIGLLWRKEAHRNRSLELVPFNEYAETGTWFAPLFGYGGNFAFFVPFGVLLYVLLRNSRRVAWRRHTVARVVVAGALFSLTIEICQYVFALGYSDIDDLIFNTLGALTGAVIARLAGPRMHRVWVWLALLLGVVFAVLVVAGPRLGDPDKVVDIYGISWDEHTVSAI